jgi:hypothetical protein
MLVVDPQNRIPAKKAFQLVQTMLYEERWQEEKALKAGKREETKENEKESKEEDEEEEEEPDPEAFRKKWNDERYPIEYADL